MKLLELVFDENLISTQLEASDNYDAMEKLGNILYTKGYVKDTFIDAVIEREKEYPTGIQGAEFNIAIPHVDNCHVKKPGIAIGVLKENVLFSRMDDPNKELDVKVIFLLAIKTPEYHLEALKEIMNLVQNAKAMNEICQCKNSKEIIKIIKREGE
ncbi:conserved hypothetical protein [[Clostridium] ultunense Esp]|nr:conserved hypothetical protein [[Clostridium] ultunense Esp]